MTCGHCSQPTEIEGGEGSMVKRQREEAAGRPPSESERALLALSLVRCIASMNYDSEEVDGEPFDMTNDDTHDTLVNLIRTSRGIVQ